MAATATEVRADLALITGAAAADLAVVAESTEPDELRGALFAVAPLLVADYQPIAAELALEWFDALRDEARPRTIYYPGPAAPTSDDLIASIVAQSTETLRDLQREMDAELEQLVTKALNDLDGELQRIVAAGFRDTIAENVEQDPEAQGWRRYARPGACKFCRFLARDNAVYSRETARFAAHTNCHCLAGPTWDADAPKATALQYVASQRERTPKQRAALRDYLNAHYPDAHG